MWRSKFRQQLATIALAAAFAGCGGARSQVVANASEPTVADRAAEAGQLLDGLVFIIYIFFLSSVWRRCARN